MKARPKRLRSESLLRPKFVFDEEDTAEELLVLPLITVRRFIVQLHKDLCLTGISGLTLAIQILLLRFNCISILHCKLHLSLINELSVSMMLYKINSIVVLKPSNIEILL